MGAHRLGGKGGAGNLALAPRTPLNATVTAGRAFAACSVPLAELKAIGRDHEATLNDMVLMLVRRPAQGKIGFFDRLTKWGNGTRNSAERLANQTRELRELDAARTNLLSALSRYGPRLLGRYHNANGTCSEPLEILSALYNGEIWCHCFHQRLSCLDRTGYAR